MTPNPRIKAEYLTELNVLRLREMIEALLYIIDKLDRGEEAATIAGYRRLCGQLGKRVQQSADINISINQTVFALINQRSDLMDQLAELRGRVCDRCKFIDDDGFCGEWSLYLWHRWNTAENGCSAWKEKT